MKLKGSLAQAGSSIVLNDGATAQATLQTTNTAASTYSLPTATDTLVGRSSTDTLTNKSIDASANTLSNIPTSSLAGSIAYSKLVLTNSVVNADIASNAAIAYSKLALTGSVLSADLAGSVAYSKLALTGSIVNADVNAAAAIAYSKLNLVSSVATGDLASGLLVPTTKGGTGVSNNAASTLTISGAFGTTLTVSGTTAVTLPTAGTLSTLAGTETLTNKTLTSPVIASITNTGTLTLPTTTDTLVARTTTDTLTNKTLSTGTVVTAGKITTAVAEVDPADNTKQWNATLSGSTTGTATTFAFAQTTNRTLTFPDATDTMVGRSTVDTLSNKTLASPTFSGYEDHTEIATPANPAASTLRLYAKSDDSFYTLNSAGVETQVGAGAGEKNYLTSASSTASGWTAVAGTGATTQATVTVSTDTTTADLPRPYTTKKGVKFVATAASGGTPVAAFGWSTFQLDPADYNKKLKVQFDQNILGGYVSGDYSIEVRSKSTAWTAPARTDGTLLPLSTDSSAVTTLPALEGTFRTTFDAPGSATPYIAVFIVPKTTATSTLVLSDVVVGPGVVVQGAVVTAPLAYTPTLIALGTVTTQSFEYSRRGSSVRVVGSLTTGTPTATAAGVGLPNGYTCHTSSGLQVVGRWEVHVATSNTIKSGPLTANSGDSAIRFGNDDYTNGGVPDTAYNGSTLFSAGALVYVYFEVEANELQGSGTVNVASNDVEYAASTTGTWDANAVVANTVYGPGGAAMSGALTTSRTKAVQFVTPIQATDKIYLEYRNATTGIWTDQAISEFPYTQTAPIAFGAGIIHNGTTSNSVTVLFNQYAQAGTTFGSATGASNWNSSFYDFWRLRKVSGGQAVGFSIVQPGTSAGLVSASGVPGNATGNSIATGYIGETLEMDQQTMQSMAPTSSTWADIPSTTLALTAGVWMVFARITVRLNSATGLTSVSGAVSQYSNTTATDHVQEKTVVQLPGVPNTNYDVASDVHYPLVVPAGGATLRLKVQYIYSGGTPQARGYICAVRIA